MIRPSVPFVPVVLRGITTHPENPLLFDFIVDTGHSKLGGKALVDETTRMVRYFLASLATPDEDLWVNLSPYENDRIIPENLGITEMGRDLLAQDYLLKQITASLVYPEDEVGQEFWQKIYKQIFEQYGTTDVPVNTFNKVWIVPDRAVVFRKGNSAYIAESHLKVMLDEDFLALKNNFQMKEIGTDKLTERDVEQVSGVSANVVREVVLPILEEEVNTGKNFALLRQIFRAHILASWYKKALRTSLLGQIYADKEKVYGVDIEDKNLKQKIYEQYLQAFRKGVYNYIKQEYDPARNQDVYRKYFSGGMLIKVDVAEISDPGQLNAVEREAITTPTGDIAKIDYDMRPASGNSGDGRKRRKISLAPAMVTTKGYATEFDELPAIPNIDDYDKLPEVIRKAIGKNTEMPYFFRMLMGTDTAARKMAVRRIIRKVNKQTPREIIEQIDAFLDTYYPYGGARQAYYDANINRTNLSLIKVSNSVQASFMNVLEFILEFQDLWNRFGQHDSDWKFIWMPATGQTQEMIMKFLIYIKGHWNDDWSQDPILSQLAKFGVDRNIPVDYTRVISYHLDTQGPQDRTDYFAFAELIRKAVDQLGIPPENRRFFFGDWIMFEDWEDRQKRGDLVMRQMTHDELKSLQKEINDRIEAGKEPWLMDEFLSGTKKAHAKIKAESPLQLRYLLAMDLQNKIMSESLEKDGGPHVVNGSLGPSYKGKGHFAFIEALMGWLRRAFMGVAGHHNIGNTTYAGGYEKYYLKTIFATFSFRDLFQRKGNKLLLTVLNNSKRFSVRNLVEGYYKKDFPRVPALALQKKRGVLIVDDGSASELWLEKYNWDFEFFGDGQREQWTKRNIVRAVYEIAWRRKKSLKDLTEQDFLRYGFKFGRVPDIILRRREENLKTLLQAAGKSWSELMTELESDLEAKIIAGEEFADFLWGKKNVEAQKRRMANFKGLRTELLVALNGSEHSEYDIRDILDQLEGLIWDKRKFEVAIEKRYPQLVKLQAELERVNQEISRILNELRGWLISSGRNPELADQIVESLAEVIAHARQGFGWNPHPDDIFLAMPYLIKYLREELGFRVITVTATTGASAVSDKYLMEVWDYIVRNFTTQDKIDRAINLSRKRETIELFNASEKRVLKDPKDVVKFDPWERQTEEEKYWRAMVHLNYAHHKLFEGKGLKTPEQLQAFYAQMKQKMADKRQGGARNPEMYDTLKIFLRVTEEKVAMLGEGMRYEDIYDPRNQAWYGTIGKNGMPREEDILENLRLMEDEVFIDFIFCNFEGFSDGGAHEALQKIMIMMVRRLMAAGIINKDTFKFVGYRGVWDVLKANAADFIIAFKKGMNELFDVNMWRRYPSQTPAQGPDASWDDLITFSRGVIRNGIATLRSVLKLITNYKENMRLAQVIDPEGMALAFQIIKFGDPDVEKELDERFLHGWKENADALGNAATEKIYGPAPLPKFYGIEKELENLAAIGATPRIVRQFFMGYVNEGPLKKDDVLQILNEKASGTDGVAELARGSIQEFASADAAELAVNPPRHGGIYLADTGEYLEIIDRDMNGLPVFDPGQLRQFQMNLKGLTPVPVGMPVPFPAFSQILQDQNPTAPTQPETVDQPAGPQKNLEYSRL